MTAPLPNIDVFHRERSKLIDAFARVEMLVQGIFARDETAKSGTLATRIRSFRQLNPNLDDNLRQCLDALDELNPLRTDLAHGILSCLDEDGKRFAVFSNAQDAAKDVQPARRLELVGMKRLTASLQGHAETLASYSRKQSRST